MRTYKVATLGAISVVGREMIRVLMERSFPIRELHLSASARNAGRKLTIADGGYIVEGATENDFGGMDIVSGAVENDIAEKYLPIAAEKGAIVVNDNSAFRLDEQVPLTTPEVNPQAVREYHDTVTNPNCATTIALVALQSLHVYTNIKRTVVSTYQVVSGTGVNGIRELDQWVGALTHGKEIAVNTFQYQIAYNLIPQTSGFNEAGYSNKEVKMQNEGRRIMSNPELCVDCTCVRAPVIRSHFESIMVEFEKEISVEKARGLLQGALGIKPVDEPQKQVYPMPLDTTDQDLVFVGRIRRDVNGHVNALSFWYCEGQARKGVATNAVQIAELVIQEKEKQQE